MMNQENIYWLFSSSAQTISAFVAFLLTGFALVHTVMDNLQQRDDSLEEIHAELKRKYFKQVVWLSIVTALAIISSLVMVYLNAYDFRYKNALVASVAVLNALAIIGGVLFVLSIINPDKYRKAAKEIIREDKAELGLTGQKVDERDFFQRFIKLEQTVREFMRHKDIPVLRGGQRPLASFKQMIDAIFYNEIIDRQFYEELQQINKYRNLVFHGHIEKVDAGMVEQVESALSRIENLAQGEA
jgi:uncharacterized membrane protein